MIGLKIPRAWEIADGQATPESLFLNRRKFLAGLGVATLGATVLRPGRAWAAEKGLYAAKRNATYKLDRPITDESVSTRYNNFYEFTGEYDVWKLVGRFKPQPWTVKVSGLVHKPQTLDVSQLLRQMPLEERLYRHRCVEAWSMAVPWTGFPFKALIDRVQPTSDARYVRLLSFLRPDEAPNQKAMPQHPWPQAQGLTLAEAMNELAFLVTGMYGHELPRQNGAPIRLAVPWKYGFKSLKSIVSIEFIDTQPHTFWSDLYPGEYHFLANVNPKETYQGKSQSTEKDIGTGELLPTLPYNGYGPFVAHLYAKS